MRRHIERHRNGDFQIVVSVLYAILFHHANSIYMLFLVHLYRTYIESINMALTLSQNLIPVRVVKSTSSSKFWEVDSHT